MRTIGASLLAAIQSGTSTLARIWKITRADATVLRFTDHDADIVMPADGTYLANNSFQISNVTTSIGRGAQAGNMRVVLGSTASTITLSDLRAGSYDKAAIQVSWVNYADPSMGQVVVLDGFLGSFDGTIKGVAEFEIVGKLQAALQGVGLKYLPECRHNFGDSGCGLTISSFSDTGTVVTSVTNNRKFSSTITGGPANNVYAFGSLEWLTGNNAGIFQEVLQQQDVSGDDGILLALNAPNDIQIGDTFTIFQGCAKTPTACKAYSNIENYGGFPFVPGPDFIEDTDG